MKACLLGDCGHLECEWPTVISGDVHDKLQYVTKVHSSLENYVPHRCGVVCPDQHMLARINDETSTGPAAQPATPGS